MRAGSAPVWRPPVGPHTASTLTRNPFICTASTWANFVLKRASEPLSACRQLDNKLTFFHAVYKTLFYCTSTSAASAASAATTKV